MIFRGGRDKVGVGEGRGARAFVFRTRRDFCRCRGRQEKDNRQFLTMGRSKETLAISDKCIIEIE